MILKLGCLNAVQRNRAKRNVYMEFRTTTPENNNNNRGDRSCIYLSQQMNFTRRYSDVKREKWSFRGTLCPSSTVEQRRVLVNSGDAW